MMGGPWRLRSADDDVDVFFRHKHLKLPTAECKRLKLVSKSDGIHIYRRRGVNMSGIVEKSSHYGFE